MKISMWKSHFTDTHDHQKQTQSYTHSFSIITRDKDNSQSCLSQFPVCEQNSCGSPKVLEHKGESCLYKKLIHTLTNHRKYTFLVLGWTHFCLQYCFKSSRH